MIQGAKPLRRPSASGQGLMQPCRSSAAVETILMQPVTNRYFSIAHPMHLTHARLMQPLTSHIPIGLMQPLTIPAIHAIGLRQP